MAKNKNRKQGGHDRLAHPGDRQRDRVVVLPIAGRPEQLRAMCEASLRRLRLDTIDLYQLHRL
ncbi:aldo/keto reductase, partial [Streptomyces sp. NPDC060223]|uniref:aldo/keto reductase n=1 Tax=Streptomyces sp. NPDC060223 TaxID=3347077 RepID=UPI003650CD26